MLLVSRHLFIALTSTFLAGTAILPSGNVQGDEPMDKKWAQFESLSIQMDQLPEHSKDGFNQLPVTEQDSLILKTTQACDLYQQYAGAIDCLKLPKLSKSEFLHLGDQQNLVASRAKQNASDWVTYKDSALRRALPYRFSEEFVRLTDQDRSKLLAYVQGADGATWLAPTVYGAALAGMFLALIYWLAGRRDRLEGQESILNTCPNRKPFAPEFAPCGADAAALPIPDSDHGPSPAPKLAATTSSSSERHCEWRHVKEMFYHCDTLVHTRLNIFLAAQAFLFLAFTRNETIALPNWWIPILGIIFTVSYWYAIARMERTVSSLKEQFRKTCKLFECETSPTGSWRRAVERRFSTYYFLVWLIPFFALLTWAMLFFNTTCLRP